MKLDNFELNQQETEIVAQNDQFKRYCLVDSMVLQPGHNAFSLDLRTGDIDIVKRDLKVALNIKTKQVHKHSQAGFNFDYLYTGALNERNARRHFEKMLIEIREKAAYVRKNALLDITKHESWPLLKSLGFTEFNGELVVACGVVEIVGIRANKETKDYKHGMEMTICSIYPKTLADGNIYYFFELIGGYSKIPVNSLNEEIIKSHTILAFDRYRDMMSQLDMFTKEYRESFNQRYIDFKTKHDVNYTAPTSKPKRARGHRPNADRQV